MFTGLVECTGVIRKTTLSETGVQLNIKTERLADLVIGESVSVSGVCLTVVEKTELHFVVDISPETLGRTTLGNAIAGDLVNLERALLPTGRMGGHFVSGHVDAIGEIRTVRRLGEFYHVALEIPSAYTQLTIEKGSIAVDGISLTINAEQGNCLELMIIPHTWGETTAHQWQTGTRVNLEFDLIAKHVQKLSQMYLESQNSLKADTRRQYSSGVSRT